MTYTMTMTPSIHATLAVVRSIAAESVYPVLTGVMMVGLMGYLVAFDLAVGVGLY